MASESRARTAVTAVAKALKAGRDIEAARVLVDAINHQALRADADLAGVLVRALGRQGLSRLIRGFARYPCFYCKQGLQECPACRGRGATAGGWVCEACIGLGVGRCDFCDAAGLVTYNFVPVGLRPAVIVERLRSPARELESVLSASVPRNRVNQKTVARQILMLNRLAGMLENAADAAKKLRTTSESTRKFSGRVDKACAASWKRISHRLQVLVKLLAVLAQKELEAISNTSSRQRAERRVGFYERLAKNARFEGTCLEHPFLARHAK